MASSRAGTASKPSGPLRTCAGCRAVAPRAALLRVVAIDGAATPDPRRRLAGRGANVHPTGECVALAIRRRSLVRALRVPDLDVRELLAWIDVHGTDHRQPPETLSDESSGADGMSAR